ncbi:MAG: hypothetical protein FJ265_01025 [Planctomycetes bacterium]|nr:hypothetical protein [Planctomycetota bacterium]
MNGRRLRRGNWSVQELERLRHLLPRRGVHDTALLLRRSPDSVFRKAMDLLKVPARRGAWTTSDDARLRDSWGVVEPRLLGPMLGRSSVEVARRAAELCGQLRAGPWTRDERQQLKELYGTRRDEDLEIALLRSRAEIAAVAAQLCLAKDKRFAAGYQRPGGAAPEVRVTMPRWTPAEVAMLQGLYPDLDNLTVARRLGRTVTGVANKANQLGLRKSPRLLADIGRTNVAHRYGHAAAERGPAGAGAAEAATEG